MLRKVFKEILIYLLGIALAYGYMVYIGETPTPLSYGYHLIYKQPYIIGSDQFKADINNALGFLKEKAPEHYRDICKYAVEIKEDSKTKSNIFATAHVGAYKITVYTLNTPPIPHAFEAMLVHETTHLKQPENLPKYKCEKEALSVERDFLRSLGMPEPEIQQFAGDYLADRLKPTAQNTP